MPKSFVARVELGLFRRSRSLITQQGQASPHTLATPDKDGDSDNDAAKKREEELAKKLSPAGHKKGNKVSEEVRAYWQSALDAFPKKVSDSVKGLLPSIDPGLVHGVHEPTSGKKPPVFDQMREWKREYPTSIILTQVGEFYEMMGIDAVVGHVYCGLRVMGKPPFPKGHIPRIGCPLPQLQYTLDALTAAGFSVAVYEEALETEDFYGRKKPPRDRILGGRVTPNAPTYMKGAVAKDFENYLENESPTAPQLGVSFSESTGISLCLVDASMEEFRLLQRATVETVSAHLHKGGVLLPLYVHKTSTSPLIPKHQKAVREWTSHLRGMQDRKGHEIKYFVHPQFVPGLLQELRPTRGLEAGVEFRERLFDSSARPHGLFQCTARNLGLVDSAGVPSLALACLPDEAPSKVKKYICGLLMNPPPSLVGASNREAVRILQDLQTPLPEFKKFLSAGSLTNFLNGAEVNIEGFHSVWQTLQAANSLFSPQLKPLAHAVLPAVETEVGSQFKAAPLSKSFRKLQEKIESVIDIENFEGQLQQQSGSADHDIHFIDAHEGQLYGRVKFDLLRPEFDQVRIAREQVIAALDRGIKELKAADNGNRTLKEHKPAALFDRLNKAIWIGTVGTTLEHKAAETSSKSSKIFFKPHGRRGEVLDRMNYESPETAKVVKRSVWTTEDLNASMTAYRAACRGARIAIEEHLRKLSLDLKPHTLDLRAAIAFNVITAALDLHARQATHQNWAPAHQAPPGKASPSELVIDRMWPYWRDEWDEKTVFNDVAIKGTNILTGPNMAGKSTIMRSLCAVTVLAACGLHVPASNARVPYIDSFTLRTFSADSPIEGLSAFAIEMLEMAHVLETVTSDSLVLLDELGKGTEPDDGAAIAATFIEDLSKVGCWGMFATHLHKVLDFKDELDMEDVHNLCMGTRMELGADGVERLRPTFKLERGECRKSLAIEVMHEHCLDDRLRDRAVQIREMIQSRKNKAKEMGFTHSEDKLDAEDHDVPALGTDDDSSVTDDEDLDQSLGIPQSQSLCTIQDAGNILAHQVGLVLAAVLEDDLQNGASALPTKSGVSHHGSLNGEERSTSKVPGSIDLTPIIIPPRLVPPGTTVCRSTVYIARDVNQVFYVGQSDTVTKRVKEHRAKDRKKNGLKHCSKLEFAVVVLPERIQGRSYAETIEGRVIRHFTGLGHKITSKKDGGAKLRPRRRRGDDPDGPKP